MRKTIYTGEIPTKEEEMENLFGFSFNTTTKLNQKQKPKRSKKYFWIFSKFLTTQEEREKMILIMDYRMKDYEHRQLD